MKQSVFNILLTKLKFSSYETYIESIGSSSCCALVSSCATITRPVTATTNPLGSKCGVTKSTVYLGLWSSKGAENGIDQAANNAGITKISHVDSYVKSYFFGIVEEQITKVYGE